MYAAPPVSVRGTGGPAWRAVQAALYGLAAAAFTVWALGQAGLALALALLPAALAAAFVAAVGWWIARAAPASVGWDGQRWALEGQPGVLSLMIDLDRWCLLRCRLDGGGTRWLALSAAEAGARWPLLRAAMHARAPRPSAAADSTDRAIDG